MLAVESPPAFFDLVELFEKLGVRELATEFLGEAPVLLANSSHVNSEEQCWSC